MKLNNLSSFRVWIAAVVGLLIASSAHAQEERTLRLMPRINVGSIDAIVDESLRRDWESLAGFSLASAGRSPSGAWIVPVPEALSTEQLKAALALLRQHSSVLWVDDKGRSVGSTPGREAGSNRKITHLVVRTKPGGLAESRFDDGARGGIRRGVFEESGGPASAGFTVERSLATGHRLLRLDSPVDYGSAMALASDLGGEPGVAYAEPVGRAVAVRIPNDAGYVRQWGLSYAPSGINAAAAWNITTGAPVTVAVIDTGILQHPDMTGKILPGYDFISDAVSARDGNGRDNDPTDAGDASTEDDACGAGRSSWHGTFVSGIIAASTNNASGIAGVSWGARILPIRVLGKCGGSFDDVVDGMMWASGLTVSGVPANPNPARILNLSLGAETGRCPAFLQEAIDAVVAQGAAVVVSAGNSQANVYDAAPAGCGGVIGVAAIGKGGDLTSYSNAGVKADIGAPGGDSSADPTESLILGATNLGRDGIGAYGYGYGAGTSFSAPHVAGVLALMLTINPDLSVGQMTTVLMQSARAYRQGSRCGAIAGNGECGVGMLDALAALKLTPSTSTPIPVGELVTVVEFYNRFLRHYFLTAAQSEVSIIESGGAGAGWERTGYNFRAFSTRGAPPFSNPVCRFYGTFGVGPNSHFYTAFPSECAFVQSRDSGWTFEGLAFNVAMPEAGTCRSGFKPIYRAYNGLGAINDSNHRYMIDVYEYVRMIQAGWQPEGAVMCAVND